MIRKANSKRKKELEKEIGELYFKDQQNKINLAMYGPPILPNSEFLLEAVNKYKKEELRKEYGYGKYQDKGLATNKGLKLEVQPYVRKENPTTVEINEYLTALRRGVDG